MTMTGDMDKECARLCGAMNAISGVRTFESCCGHGRSKFRVWFLAESLKCLPRLLYYFDGCHCGFYGWKVVAETDCAMSPVTFCVEGPSGREAYEQAEQIAGLLEKEARK
jgi:hypothetical protein